MQCFDRECAVAPAAQLSSGGLCPHLSMRLADAEVALHANKLLVVLLLQVGKALLTLAKLYMADGGANSRQLATAAISRAQDIMTVCQVRWCLWGLSLLFLLGRGQRQTVFSRFISSTSVLAGS